GGVGDGGARGAGRLGGEDEEQRWAVDAEGAESLDRQPLAQAQRGGYALDPLLLDPRRVLFFFQAEGGIGDWSVTGVQTCALPISDGHEPGVTGRGAKDATQSARRRALRRSAVRPAVEVVARSVTSISPDRESVVQEVGLAGLRSEERRVGKGGEVGGRGGGVESNG